MTVEAHPFNHSVFQGSLDYSRKALMGRIEVGTKIAFVNIETRLEKGKLARNGEKTKLE